MPQKPLRPVKSYMNYFFSGLIIAAVLLIIGVNNFLRPMISATTAEVKPLRVTIPQGTSGAEIAKILADKNLIRNESFFRLLIRWEGAGKNLKAGEYELSPTLNPRQLIKLLTSGDVYENYVRVTIPEGYTIRQITHLLDKEGIIERERFLELIEKGDFPFHYISDIPQEVNYRLEGYLFPDTYYFSREASEEEIIRRMLERFNDITEGEIKEQAQKLGLSLHEIVTLASLIEREALLAEERELIAGVFYNRLEKGMLLGSCATVQYILGEPKANLTTKDTQIPSIYNTYLHAGLPPGPIASPGKDSLLAAVRPRETDFLYFRARDDGSHVFSRTLAEHNRAGKG